MLQALLRVTAILMLVIFVLLFPVTLAARDIGALIFDPATTKTLVRTNLLDSQLIDGLVRQATQEMLFSGVGGGSDQPSGETEQGVNIAALDEVLNNLSQEDWEQLTNLTAPTALLEENVNQVVDAYSLWLNSDQHFPPLQVDLKLWKENTQNNAGAVMRVLLDAMPACSTEEIRQISQQNMNTLQGVAGSIQACRPPEPYYSLMIGNADILVQESLRRAPDLININLMAENSEAPNEFVQFKTSLLRARLVVNWSWVAVAGFAALAVALAAHGFKSMLRWAGWPLLITGAATVVLGLGLQLFSLHFLDDLVAQALPAEAGAVGAMGKAIASGALDLVSTPLLLQGLAITSIGIGSVFYAGMLTRREASPGIPLNQKRMRL